MKKIVMLGALLAAGALTFQNSGFGHGGTYRGPGDTVPPGGGGGGGGGGAPTTPGPSGPTVPGPSRPKTGGPVQPGAPAGGGPRVPITGAIGGADLSIWQFWWGFNKAPYLNLRAAIHAKSVQTMGEDFFLGWGTKSNPSATLAPTELMIRDQIVPALLLALETERDNDIVTGCMIALARIGEERDEQGKSRFELKFLEFLADSSKEIAETAAIAIGILGDSGSISLLESLMFDAPEGRARIERESGVPERTRAFAAYGLGLIGARCNASADRERIVAALHSIVEGGRQATRDLQVAAVVASGLVPLESDAAILPAEHDPAAPLFSREEQVIWLLDFLASQDKQRAPYLVQAHVPRAVAQLLDGADPALVGIARDAFTEPLTRKGTKGRAVLRQSCALALGRIADLDLDPGDVAARQALMNGVRDSDQSVKSFCLIALAQLAERPGGGDGADVGISEVRRFLMRQLAGGRSAGKSWAGLAIGIMERALYERDVQTSPDSLLALKTSLKKATSTREVGAYAIALGLAEDLESEMLLLDKLDSLSDDEARGYLAVGLGLMHSNSAKETIQELVADSKHRGTLLREASIALGLLGDKQVVGVLTTMLEDEAKALSTQAAIASALGFIGDRDAVGPLIRMLNDQKLSKKARAFAAVALGLVADKEMLPWNSKLSVDINYLANTRTLTGDGLGILDML